MTYQSPYSLRYGTEDMRALWSEEARRLIWRQIWVAVAEAQASAGLVTEEQVEDLKRNSTQIDLHRAYEIEAEIDHDLMAELKAYAEQCPEGGSILHWGLTSEDVKDNAETIRQRSGLLILKERLQRLLLSFAERIDETADLTVMGYTHLQAAEPTTLGYRLATYAQDLMIHLENFEELHKSLKCKGIRGAVGTSAAFSDMLSGSSKDVIQFESEVLEALDLNAFEISTQTYPRIQDYALLSSLAALAASLHKFAFDLRILQSPGFDTLSEPFGEKQVGSSSMPFKRNPVKSEKVCSLARLVSAAPSVAWQNAANHLLERTLDDSANRRTTLPEAFLATDEMLVTCKAIVDGLQINEKSINTSLNTYGPFSAIERVLTALVKAGADRQEMHEKLRQHSIGAWNAIKQGHQNPLIDKLCDDPAIIQYIKPEDIRNLTDVNTYTGLAHQKAKALAERINSRINKMESKDTQ